MAKQKDALQALLGANTDIQEDVYIKRLDVNFVVKALDNETIEQLNEQATYTVGKGNKRRKEVNQGELSRLIIAEACVSPDFNSDDLKKHYGADDKADCVQKALLAGELAKLSQAIMEVSGFDDDDDELEEVKN